MLFPASSYVKLTFRNSMPCRSLRERQRPRPFLDLRVRVENLEDALGGGHRLLQARVHAAQLLHRRVHHEGRGQERRELPLRQRPLDGDLMAAVPDQGHDGQPRRAAPSAAAGSRARASPSGSSGRDAATRGGTAALRAPSAPNAFTMRWPVNASAVTCDRCSSSSWLLRVVLRMRLPNLTSG